MPDEALLEEFAPPREAVEDDEPPPKPKKRRRTKAPAAAPSPPVIIDVDADEDASTSAARPAVDTGVDVHEVDPHWATHNLPGRGCGGRTFHHPTLGPSAEVEVAALSNARSCWIVWPTYVAGCAAPTSSGTSGTGSRRASTTRIVSARVFIRHAG